VSEYGVLARRSEHAVEDASGPITDPREVTNAGRPTIAATVGAPIPDTDLLKAS